MAINLTVARPYAKAVFDLALHSDQVIGWRHVLTKLALVAIECRKQGILNNPKIAMEKKADFFLEVTAEFPAAIGLVRFLAERKKLIILPDIAAYYQQLVLVYNETLEVKVVAAFKLSAAQKERLFEALQQRYHCKILLQYSTDSKLIGGAVVFIADLVIDHSIKGMLQKLKQNLIFKE